MGGKRTFWVAAMAAAGGVRAPRGRPPRAAGSAYRYVARPLSRAAAAPPGHGFSPLLPSTRSLTAGRAACVLWRALGVRWGRTRSNRSDLPGWHEQTGLLIVDFAAVDGRWGAGAGAPLARLLLRALPPGVGYGIMRGNRCGGGIASSAAADGTDAARSGCGVKSQLFRF